MTPTMKEWTDWLSQHGRSGKRPKLSRADVAMTDLHIQEDFLHIGFTGNQEGMTDAQKDVLEKLLVGLAPGWFHHGWCIGSDEQSDPIARNVGFQVIGHPPIKTTKMSKTLPDPAIMCEPRDYLDRNTDIAVACPVVIAAPKQTKEILYSGTWSTIRRARKYSTFTIILWPNGHWECEFHGSNS